MTDPNITTKAKFVDPAVKVTEADAEEAKPVSMPLTQESDALTCPELSQNDPQVPSVNNIPTSLRDPQISRSLNDNLSKKIHPNATTSNTESHQHHQEQELLSSFAVPKPPAVQLLEGSGNDDRPRTLWMGDLDPWLDEEAIINFWWKTLQKRVSAKIIKPKTRHVDRNVASGYNGLSHSGYCFIKFDTYEDAEEALGLNGQLLPDIALPSQQHFPNNPNNQKKYFRLNWASGINMGSSSTTTPEYSLFVGDLSASTTEAHLLAFFQTKFSSSIKTVRVMTDPVSGKSRCFGFVRFTDELERQRALTEMNGVWLGGRPLRVALATPRANPKKYPEWSPISSQLLPNTPQESGFQPVLHYGEQNNFSNGMSGHGGFPETHNHGFAGHHYRMPIPPFTPQSPMISIPGGFQGSHVYYGQYQHPDKRQYDKWPLHHGPGKWQMEGNHHNNPLYENESRPLYEEDNRQEIPLENGPQGNIPLYESGPGKLVPPDPGNVLLHENSDQVPLYTEGLSPSAEVGDSALGYAPLGIHSNGTVDNRNWTDPNNTTVFVGGLSAQVTEATLHTLFESFGDIRQVKIPPGKNCGFIKYSTRAQAETAIATMQGFIIGGNRVRLSWGRPSSGHRRYDSVPQQAFQHDKHLQTGVDMRLKSNQVWLFEQSAYIPQHTRAKSDIGGYQDFDQTSLDSSNSSSQGLRLIGTSKRSSAYNAFTDPDGSATTATDDLVDALGNVSLKSQD